MSLTMKDMAEGQAKKYPVAPAGVHPGRISHVVDIGVQNREWKGEVKAPARQLAINIEMVNSEYEQDGEKRRHRISPRPFNVMTDSKAALQKFLKAIDPKNTINGDFTKLAGLPLMVSVIHTTKAKDGKEITYANFGGAMPAPEGFPIKELSGNPILFSFDEPTEDQYKLLPKFLKDKIKSAVNYAGSKVEKIASKVDADYEAARAEAEKAGGKPKF